MWFVSPPADPPVLTPQALTAQVNIDWELVALAIALLGLNLGGWCVIVRIKRWQTDEQPTLPTRLEDYRALMEKGILDAQEFDRIRERLEKSTPPPDSTAPSGPATT